MEDNEEEEVYDDIETLEDLKGEEEVEVKKKIDGRKKVKIDPNYPQIYLNDSQVTPQTKVDFCSSTIRMKPSQRELINFVQYYLGFGSRVELIRFVLLAFSREQMDIINAKREVDAEFIKKFKQIREETLNRKNNIKERIEKLKKIRSQDGGGDPFTAEDLME